MNPFETKYQNFDFARPLKRRALNDWKPPANNLRRDLVVVVLCSLVAAVAVWTAAA